MKLTEQYRQHAADALEKARTARDMQARQEWLNIAGEWTALAKARMETLMVAHEPKGGHEHRKPKSH